MVDRHPILRPALPAMPALDRVKYMALLPRRELDTAMQAFSHHELLSTREPDLARAPPI